MSAKFRAVDRSTPHTMPVRVDDWLANDDLARFVVDMDSHLILIGHLTKKTNDEEEWIDAIGYRMKILKGKGCYSRRKGTVEPVFGVIKEAMGLR